MKGDLELKGYEIRELDNLITIPKAKFRHRDGRIVELPADTFHLNYYLRKGLVLVHDNMDTQSK